jgi:hypothetical protein
MKRLIPVVLVVVAIAVFVIDRSVSRPPGASSVSAAPAAVAEEGTPTATPAPIAEGTRRSEAKRDEAAPSPESRFIPAWKVNLPPSDPNTPQPPLPAEPPDPRTTRLPMHNPGGINGDRPERKVPGLP